MILSAEALRQNQIPIIMAEISHGATVRDMSFDIIKTTDHSITIEAVKANSTKIIPSGNVVIATRVGLGKVCKLLKDTAINQDLRAIIPRSNEKLSREYLFWWLKSIAKKIEAEGTGATVKGVKLPFVKSLEIPLPPLEEQRRIVALLDEAFAGIDTAIANTEKSLANARELFLSTLRASFAKPSDDWVIEPIFPTVRFIDYRGKTPPKTDEGIRLVTAKNVKFGYIQHEPREFVDPDAYDEWMTRGIPQPGDVLFTTEAPLGNVAQLDGEGKVMVGQRLITMRPDPKKLRPAFLKYMLLSEPLQESIWANATGATVQGIKAKLLKLIPIRYPQKLADQDQVTEVLDEVWRLKTELADTAQIKLNSLQNLKLSIFQRAFSGEFTVRQNQSEQVSTKMLTATPEFTAQIIALAQYNHNQTQRPTFGRVKAAKTLQLAESIAGIDLDRKPEKWAAGPHDEAHLKACENWAETNKFFRFRKRDTGGYDFIKLSNYQDLLATAKKALQPYSVKLEKIITILAPMNSKEAEVFATVHAAWNNLIVDDVEISDDAIVREARDDWHSDKFDIEESKFRDAILLIRQKGVEPDGTAKYVGGQGKLF